MSHLRFISLQLPATSPLFHATVSAEGVGQVTPKVTQIRARTTLVTPPPCGRSGGASAQRREAR